jgi:hypothetical protein
MLLVAHDARADDPAVPPPAPPPADVSDVHVVDGLGVLAIARHSDAFADATYEHADGADAIALVPGARLRIGDVAFLEGQLPVAYGVQPNAAALGNVTITAGLLPRELRLVAVALRLGAATSPRLGGGMQAVQALALPRVADPELFLAHTTSAELVADWRWRGAASWVQAELGLAGRWQPSPAGFEPVLRATAAAGISVEPWLDLAASFVTRSYLLESHPSEDFVHTLMLGILAHHPRGEIAVRLEVPIDDSARNANRFVVGLELRGR